MRRLFLFLMGATFFSSMKADGEFPYFTFVGSDGTVTSLGVESLEMTVTEDGSLVAVNGDGSKTFTLTGIFLGKFTESAKAKASLEQGVYILKSKSETLKITVR